MESQSEARPRIPVSPSEQRLLDRFIHVGVAIFMAGIVTAKSGFEDEAKYEKLNGAIVVMQTERSLGEGSHHETEGPGLEKLIERRDQLSKFADKKALFSSALFVLGSMFAGLGDRQRRGLSMVHPGVEEELTKKRD